MFARTTDVGEHAHLHAIARHQEAMRVCRIMKFWKRSDGEAAHLNGLIGLKGDRQMLLKVQPVIVARALGDINGKLIFFRQPAHPIDMVGVFMRDKNRFHLVHGKPEALHAPLRFAAGETRVNQHRFIVIADVVTVAVTA